MSFKNVSCQSCECCTSDNSYGLNVKNIKKLSECLFTHFHKPFPYNENSTWINHVMLIRLNSIYIDWIFDDLYITEREGVSKETF